MPRLSCHTRFPAGFAGTRGGKQAEWPAGVTAYDGKRQTLPEQAGPEPAGAFVCGRGSPAEREEDELGSVRSRMNKKGQKWPETRMHTGFDGFCKKW